MIQIHYKVCPAAYAALTGKGNKLVIATWIRFIENTHSGWGVEIGFGFVMQCFANKLLLTCGAKWSDQSAAVIIGRGAEWLTKMLAFSLVGELETATEERAMSERSISLEWRRHHRNKQRGSP